MSLKIAEMTSRLDIFLMAILVISFAAAVTAHVTLILGLGARPPRWRALIAFVVPVLAPYWGFRERMVVRSSIWILALLVYVAARLAERSIADRIDVMGPPIAPASSSSGAGSGARPP